jgi:hypothetical protein
MFEDAAPWFDKGIRVLGTPVEFMSVLIDPISLQIFSGTNKEIHSMV